MSAGVGEAQIAKDIGISETTLLRWVKQADIDDGMREGPTSDELEELRREERRLERENEILRRAAAYFAKDALPK